MSNVMFIFKMVRRRESCTKRLILVLKDISEVNWEQSNKVHMCKIVKSITVLE